MAVKRLVPSPVYSVYCRHRQSDCRSVINNEAGSRRTMLECCCRKLKKFPKNTNGRLAIPALAGLLVYCATSDIFDTAIFCPPVRHVDSREAELNHVAQWAHVNILKPNRAKSVEVIFTSNRRKLQGPSPPQLPDVRTAV